MADETRVKTEIKRLASQNADRSLTYPGDHRLVWVKPPGMPWLLAAIEPCVTDADG